MSSPSKVLADKIAKGVGQGRGLGRVAETRRYHHCRRRRLVIRDRQHPTSSSAANREVGGKASRRPCGSGRGVRDGRMRAGSGAQGTRQEMSDGTTLVGCARAYLVSHVSDYKYMPDTSSLNLNFDQSGDLSRTEPKSSRVPLPPDGLGGEPGHLQEEAVPVASAGARRSAHART